MPSTPNASEYLFTGSVAYILPSSTVFASEYLFTGGVKDAPLDTATPNASEYLFVGNVADDLSGRSLPRASEYIFTNALVAPSVAVGTGIVMFPISEDASFRPPIRY